jgi:L-2-hydroxyglutarate oxidase
LVVVGGGIVGLSCAWTLSKRCPHLRIGLLEKQAELARHQTGHNSGVIHSGIYYRPGSLKAELCRQGRVQLLEFCRRQDIQHRLSGKLIVACSATEVERLHALEERGRSNGLEGLRRCTLRQARLHEPEVGGLEALHVPEAGVVDYRAVCGALAQELGSMRVEVRLAEALRSVELTETHLRLRTTRGRLRTRWLLNCGGLHADRIARLAGADVALQVVPFRGEYWRLGPGRRDLVRGLIYPVPDPDLPFLGVHLTRNIQGEVEAGPNALLALAREGYRRRNVEVRQIAELALSGPFWRMAAQWWPTAVDEFRRSLTRAALVAALRPLLPALRPGDLRRSGSGVRAQAIDRDGRLLDDFAFGESSRALHVLSAPSPAATAAFAIAMRIADRAREQFGI